MRYLAVLVLVVATVTSCAKNTFTTTKTGLDSSGTPARVLDTDEEVPDRIADNRMSRESQLSPEEERKLLQTARDMYECLRSHVKRQDADSAMRAYLGIRLEQFERQTVLIRTPEYRAEISRIFSSARDEGLIGRKTIRELFDRAKEKLKRMKKLFESGEYGQVPAVHEELRELTLEWRRVDEDFAIICDQIVGRSDEWVRRARESARNSAVKN